MPSIRFVFAFWLILAGFSSLLPAWAEARDFKPLEAVVQQAVREGVFPGASVAVLYRDRVVFHKAFGRLTYERKSSPADTSTIYDLASLTKVVSTTAIVMQLVERDSLSLSAPVSRYLPGFTGNGKEKVTIEQLLRHTSGLRAHTYFAKTCRTPDEVFRAIEADSLVSEPGKTTLYSDLGFMLLGRIIETLTHQTLAANFHHRFGEPLGMNTTMFTPPPSLVERIAPVEKDTLWPFATPRPLVHDQNAALLGGVAGHAGLYATTGDLVRMVRMLMHGGTLGNHLSVRKATLAKFLAASPDPRALGWDRRTPGSRSSSGDYFSTASYGHLGYTGTSIWIDPEKELAVILLSNRVYPTSENIGIRTLRPLLHNTVIECLGLK